MIHFDFKVSDEDAQTIMDALYDKQLEAKERLRGVQRIVELKELTANEKEWWQSHEKYLADLLTRMNNKKC